jgi:hypothetical protein
MARGRREELRAGVRSSSGFAAESKVAEAKSLATALAAAVTVERDEAPDAAGRRAHFVLLADGAPPRGP